MQTIPFSVTGHPALSMPIGFARNGLPIGLQVIGRAFGEASVLRVAAALETELGQRHTRPPVPAQAGSGQAGSGQAGSGKAGRTS
jgi:aspartyl-tRNA(Asn)/glutamyl-tRNA(Gln) amidotransferase subunit A